LGIGLFNDVSQILPQPTLVAMATSPNWLLLRLYERYRRDPCVYQGVFWVGLLNDVSQILPRPSVVAMATKFKLKLAISRLLLSPRSWRLSVCIICARSTLDRSQSKILLVLALLSYCWHYYFAYGYIHFTLFYFMQIR